MAFQPVPDTYQFLLSGTLPGGKIWELALYAKSASYAQPDQSFADSIMSHIHDAYTDNGVPAKLSSSWQWSTLTVTGLDAEGDAQVVSNAHTVTGTDSSNPLPNQTALLINWRTASRGRSYRGRSFHPGFTEAQSQGNEPVSGVFTVMNDWTDQLISDLGTNGVPLQVVSRFSGTELVGGPHGQVLLKPVKRDVAVTTPITAADIDDRWKTQRRRQLAG